MASTMTTCGEFLSSSHLFSRIFTSKPPFYCNVEPFLRARNRLEMETAAFEIFNNFSFSPSLQTARWKEFPDEDQVNGGSHSPLCLPGSGG